MPDPTTDTGALVEPVAVEDVLSPRQEQMIESVLSIAEDFGPFDASSGSEGAHYAPADSNPFIADGLVCHNCEMYQPISETEGRCSVVQGPLTDGLIEPDAVCKLWVIPESSLTAQRKAPMPAEQRVVTPSDIEADPALLAELRDGTGDIAERRVAPANTEIRANADGSWTLIGHAAVFDSVASLGTFSETIKRGAFRRVLNQDGLDVRCLFNHDANLVLGRTPGTLTLREDPQGLAYEVNVAPTTAGNDLKVLLERGDVTQSSFAFKVGAQEWRDMPDGSLQRIITDFADLLDVSPVTYPAYSDTTASVRSALVSSTGSSEQEVGGAAKQPNDQANDSPRRADEKGAHRHRLRRQRLRDSRAA